MTERVMAKEYSPRIYDHQLYTPEGMEGAAACRVCLGFEVTLPTNCPGQVLTEEQEKEIYAGNLDFIRGEWWRPVREDRD